MVGLQAGWHASGGKVCLGSPEPNLQHRCLLLPLLAESSAGSQFLTGV